MSSFSAFLYALCSWNSWNSRWNFEIPALLLGGNICLISLVKNAE